MTRLFRTVFVALTLLAISAGCGKEEDVIPPKDVPPMPAGKKLSGGSSSGGSSNAAPALKP